MKDNLVIVGSHPRTREEFDFSRTDCDIWVFNEALSTSWAKRADAVFQMHEEAIWRNPKNRNDPGHFTWLTTQTDVPVYMQDTYSEVPMAQRYPVEEVGTLLDNLHINKNGASKPVRYFASSVDYALALGIYKGYKKIEVYGVELASQTEYFYQRTGFGLWSGIAVGRGIQLEMRNMIFDAPLYGYEGDVALEYDLFVNRIKELTPTRDELAAQYEKQKDGTAQALETVIVTPNKENQQKFLDLLKVQKELGGQISTLDGRIQENQRYIEKADAMKAASGGTFLFSRQEFEGSSHHHQKNYNEAAGHAQVSGGRCEVLFGLLVKTGKEKHRRKKAGGFMKMLEEHLRHTFYAALFIGAFEENLSYLKTLDAYIRAAGGSKSEAVLLEAHENRN